jgi:uncharacterized RDD family membrane protein YckC
VNSGGAVKSPALRYVGFWMRFIAFLIDSAIVMAVLTPLLYAIHGSGDWERLSELLHEALARAAAGGDANLTKVIAQSGFAGPADFLVQVVLPIAALLAFWKFRSATPGKMAIGARILDVRMGGQPSNLQLLVRFAGYFVSMFALGLGFIWIGVDRRKQGWHDKISGTVVVYEEKGADK